MTEVPTERLKLKDKRFLSPPLVGAPLYQCAKAVVVYGFDPGATLDVQVNGTTVLAGVAGGFPQPQGALLTLPAPLVAGEVIRARQKAGGLPVAGRRRSSWATTRRTIQLAFRAPRSIRRLCINAVPAPV